MRVPTSCTDEAKMPKTSMSADGIYIIYTDEIKFIAVNAAKSNPIGLQCT